MISGFVGVPQVSEIRNARCSDFVDQELGQAQISLNRHEHISFSGRIHSFPFFFVTVNVLIDYP